MALMIALAGCDADGPQGATEDVGPPVDGEFPMEGGDDARSVRIGLSGPDMDACAGYGEVRPTSGNGQSVHAAPLRESEAIDVLAAGQGVAICEMAGAWLGVVYAPEDGDLGDCETASPVAEQQDYAGPCPSGWVRDGAVDFVAG